jgi:hypothetical protein
VGWELHSIIFSSQVIPTLKTRRKFRREHELTTPMTPLKIKSPPWEAKKLLPRMNEITFYAIVCVCVKKRSETSNLGFEQM